MLNAVARLVVVKKKCDSFTSTIRDNLHWLLWCDERVDFKICLLVYNIFTSSVTLYLVSMITAVSAVRRHLCSACQGDLFMPWTRGVGYLALGPRNFLLRWFDGTVCSRKRRHH